MRAEGLRDISSRESVARAGEPDITISRENAPAQARTSEEVAISRESTLALAVARKRETRGERERERERERLLCNHMARYFVDASRFLTTPRSSTRAENVSAPFHTLSPHLLEDLV